MPAQINGKVAVFNIAGTLALTGTGMLATDEMANKSASLTSSATPVDLSVGGVVVTRAYINKQRTIAITVVPYDPDSPGSLATLKAKVKLPAEGSVVTLADWDSPDYNGDWNFENGSINANESQFLQMTFNLSRVGETSGVPSKLTPQS